MTVQIKYNDTFNQLLFANHAGDFGASPATAANSLLRGTQTDVELDLDGVGASGGAAQSAKTASLSASSSRAAWYRVDACIEFESAPTDNDGTVDFYWAASPSGTAGTGNPAGVTGSAGSFTDTSGNLAQLQYIGSLSVRNNVINIGYVGSLIPEHEYGSLVVVNNCGTAMRSTATAMDETHITLTPMGYLDV